MSNVAEIEIIEYNVVGEDKKSFGIIFHDDYATVFHRYLSIDEIKEEYPTKQSLVDAMVKMDEFAGFDYFLEEEYTKRSDTFCILVNVYGYE